MARRRKSKPDPDAETPRTVEEVGRTESGERIVAVPLKVKLSQEERIAKGSELTTALDDLERLEGEKSKTQADYNRLIKDQRKSVRGLREAYKNGVEERPVSCREEMDYARGVVRLVRIEDDHVVETRTMTPAERQMPLGADVEVVHSGDGAEAHA